MMKKAAFLIVLLILLGMGSCSKNPINPDIKPAVVRIDINPNSIFYQNLNTVGGFIYVRNGDDGVYLSPESRGVIIYRSGIDAFKAYDRIPPNSPDQCGTSTMLEVGTPPFVEDPCTGNKYLLTDGSLVQGTGKYPMIQYHAEYDGTLLHIYN